MDLPPQDGQFVDNSVGVDLKAGVGNQTAFLAIVEDAAVLRIDALLNNVAADNADPAIGKIDAVGGRAAVVKDTVIGNRRRHSPALDLVPDDRIMDIAVVDGETCDRPDIDVVGRAVAGSVVGELGGLNVNDAGGGSIAENSILIIVDIRIGDRQMAGVVADARAVAVTDGGIGELNVIEGDIGVGDEDSFTVARWGGGDEMSQATDPDNTDLGVGGAVVRIRAGLHVNDIAILRGGDCRSHSLELKSGTDSESSRLRTSLRLQKRILPARVFVSDPEPPAVRIELSRRYDVRFFRLSPLPIGGGERFRRGLYSYGQCAQNSGILVPRNSAQETGQHDSPG